METVKTTGEFKIFKKRNGRYGIKSTKGKWINGEEKVKILTSEGLIKISAAKKKEEAPAPEEAAAPATEEAPAAETPAE